MSYNQGVSQILPKQQRRLHSLYSCFVLPIFHRIILTPALLYVSKGQNLHLSEGCRGPHIIASLCTLQLKKLRKKSGWKVHNITDDDQWSIFWGLYTAYEMRIDGCRPELGVCYISWPCRARCTMHISCFQGHSSISSKSLDRVSICMMQ